MTDNRKTIRGIDDKLFEKARVLSIKEKITLGQLVNQALLLRLKK